MKSGLTIRSDLSGKILQALKEVGKKDVLVGIPEGKSEREDADIGNAAIGYINENGSPAQNIPARPHLVPGVRKAQSETLPLLKSAAQSILTGDGSAATRDLNRAGFLAVNAVKAVIDESGFVPLADGTVAARARKGRKGAKAEMKSRANGGDPNNANAMPLIDTGEYRDSITYVVRDKNANS
ncbi:hypothetical protein HGT70_04005 [Rosenbergiella collisarenosi]|uniref:hypothetical protein n=1 Tax=Rosenbergiella collisarenosi TaxID=1544695 RepID=UPI001BDA4E34|nr:hypothetical protein [Rosenbergiella collisarenosi]MBT0720444.1 hypothetical protein [Rosenbergiella collisarenosi]